MSKPKSAFRFWNGFKVACGAYLGWNLMTGLDRGFMTVMNQQGFSTWVDRKIAELKKKS